MTAAVRDDEAVRLGGRGRRLLAVAGVVLLPVLTTPLPAPAAAPGVMPSPGVTSSPGGSVAGGRGSELYRQSCASCHGNAGEGTQRGPAIAGVGPASVDFQLSTGRMPLTQERHADQHRSPAFSAADMDALVRYVAALPPGGGPAIPRVVPGDSRSGRELYLTYCSACHSAAGVGGVLNNGRVAPKLDRATPTQVGEAIRVGPGTMPAFPPDVLSDRDVDALAAYVGVLRNDRGRLDRGGLSLGRLGPLPEGAVAWVVGLGVLVLLARRLGSRAR